MCFPKHCFMFVTCEMSYFVKYHVKQRKKMFVSRTIHCITANIWQKSVTDKLAYLNINSCVMPLMFKMGYH